MKYIRTSIDVFNSRCKSGKWVLESAPKPWNAFNAVAIVKEKNKEYKIIIVNYFIINN